MLVARAHRRGVLLLMAALACTPKSGEPTPHPTETASEAPAPTPAPAPAPAKPTKPAAQPVEVVVRDLAGRTIAGARVIDYSDKPLDERTHLTDERGVAVVPGGTAVNIVAPGFVTLMGGRVPRSGRVDLHLLPESVITGRVVDPHGQPVADVDVDVGGQRSSDAKTKTDADGRFRLGGLGPGRRLLTVRGRGVLGDRMVAVGFAETASIEVPVTRAATIEARVVRAESGAPCPGGYVTLYVGVEGPAGGCPICGGEDPTLTAPIAADGTVRVEVARGLIYGVEVACTDALKMEPDPIFVTDADVTGLRWEAPRGLQIRGKVVDPDGRPLPGIEVLLRSADDDLLPDELGDTSAVTDASGQFTLEGLVEATYEVEAYSEEPRDIYYEGSTYWTLKDVDLEGVVLVVNGKPWEDRDDRDDDDDDEAAPAPAQIRGIVRDARGAPVADALVVVDDDVELHRAPALLARTWNGRAPTRSDAHGAFEAPAPRLPGEDDDDEPLTILAYAPGGAIGLAEVKSLDKPVELRVRPPAALTTRVRDRRGRPITHYGIDLERERPRPEYVHAPGGVFSIPGLLPGPYKLRIHTPEGDTGAWVQVPADRSPAAVTFEPRGEVEELVLRLRDVQTYDEVAGCKVSVSPVGGPRRAAVVSDDGGRVEFANIASGPTQLHVLPCTAGGKRYPAQSRQVHLRPDATKMLFMTIAGHDAALSGRGGDLGYAIAPRRPDVDPILQPLRVTSLRRGGPAEQAGLRVGDVIVRVGDYAVNGRRSYLHEGLTRVSPGTRVTLGLADGRTLELTAAHGAR